MPFLKNTTSPTMCPRWFNAMTGPMQKFPIKGVVWYQGEANAKTVARAKQYATLFPAMIQSWRKGWNNPEMPFCLFNWLVGAAPTVMRFGQPKGVTSASFGTFQHRDGNSDRPRTCQQYPPPPKASSGQTPG